VQSTKSRTPRRATLVNWLLDWPAMGNLSYSVSGFGAGDASRKSVRGSTRSCKRQRSSSSCCHYADSNWLISVLGDLHRAKATRYKRGQIAKNEVGKVVSTATLEELLDDCAGLFPDSVDFDVSNDCISPFTEVGSSECSGGDDSGEGSGYFSDDYQLVASIRDEEVDDDDDDVMVMCEEDKAMMMLRTSTTICGEEWINWTALCPCCRRDASDDSIDLQEMIKLEPIRASIAQALSFLLSYIKSASVSVFPKYLLSINEISF